MSMMILKTLLSIILLKVNECINVCPDISLAVEKGLIDFPEISEGSGMVYSAKNSLLWTINDSAVRSFFF